MNQSKIKKSMNIKIESKNIIINQNNNTYGTHHYH